MPYKVCTKKGCGHANGVRAKYCFACGEPFYKREQIVPDKREKEEDSFVPSNQIEYVNFSDQKFLIQVIGAFSLALRELHDFGVDSPSDEILISKIKSFIGRKMLFSDKDIGRLSQMTIEDIWQMQLKLSKKYGPAVTP